MRVQTNQLSKREREVAELLLQGKGNKQIALELGIAESTVEFHLKNIYAKLQVSSRAQAILKLGKSTGPISENPRESVVERSSETSHTRGESIPQKEIKMKNRWRAYFLVGLIFGAAYWHYFSATASLLSRIFVTLEENPFVIWVGLSVSFLIYFSVWLVPAILPAVYEFRHSKRISLSISAVVIAWLSAVLGYYINYIQLLIDLFSFT